MISAPLGLDESTFRRSGFSVTRRKACSERTANSRNKSLRQKMEQVTLDNEEQLDIYFNRTKRRTYFKSVIDNYFAPDLQSLQPSLTLCPPALPRESATSESPIRPKRAQHISLSRLKFKQRLSMLDFNAAGQVSSLPVIDESLKGPKRPASEYKPSSLLSLDKEMEESLFCESNKSMLEHSNQSQLIEQFDGYRFTNTRKGGRRFSRTRVFSSNDNQQLLRQLAAKRLGVELLWKSHINQSLEYPHSKSLRQMCCSVVEDKNGQEPILQLFPTPYYYSLFANQNEELVDIVLALAKAVAKTKGNIANNQIHMGNIVKLKEKQFLLADWGCAALRESLTIQGRTFSKDIDPLCKSQNKWALSPQYLSPELLRATQSGSYQHLWRQKGGIGACDVWSIGCLLYQIITLLPLTSPYYCALKGKQQRKRPHFGTKLRTAQTILVKQKNFKTLAMRTVREEMRLRKQVRVCDKLLELLPRMLEQSAEQRISAEQIVARLG